MTREDRKTCFVFRQRDRERCAQIGKGTEETRDIFSNIQEDVKRKVGSKDGEIC